MDTELRLDRLTALVDKLVAVLREVTEGRLGDDIDTHGPNSLRRLGLDSLSTLSFMVAVEDAFGIEWADDVPEDVLASFDAMAAYISKELGDAG